MTMIAEARPVVTGGVDTHLDVHVAAVVTAVGGVLGTEQFPTTAAGYQQLLSWMRGFGDLDRVGVEGTGSDATPPTTAHCNASWRPRFDTGPLKPQCPRAPRESSYTSLNAPRLVEAGIFAAGVVLALWLPGPGWAKLGATGG